MPSALEPGVEEGDGSIKHSLQLSASQLRSYAKCRDLQRIAEHTSAVVAPAYLQPPPSSSPLAALPSDLLERIFDLLKPDDRLSLSRTSTTIRHSTWPLFFRRMVFKQFHRFVGLSRHLAQEPPTPEAQRILQRCRSLSITTPCTNVALERHLGPGLDREEESDYVRDLVEGALADLVARAGSLRRLSWHLCRRPPSFETLLPALRASSVTELSLCDSCPATPDADRKQDQSLTEPWLALMSSTCWNDFRMEHLTSLELHATIHLPRGSYGAHRLGSDALDQLLLGLPKLTTLRIKIKTLETLLPGCVILQRADEVRFPHLKILELVNCGVASPETLLQLLERHDKLESLKIVADAPFLSDPPARPRHAHGRRAQVLSAAFTVPRGTHVQMLKLQQLTASVVALNTAILAQSQPRSVGPLTIDLSWSTSASLSLSPSNLRKHLVSTQSPEFLPTLRNSSSLLELVIVLTGCNDANALEGFVDLLLRNLPTSLRIFALHLPGIPLDREGEKWSLFHIDPAAVVHLRELRMLTLPAQCAVTANKEKSCRIPYARKQCRPLSVTDWDMQSVDLVRQLARFCPRLDQVHFFNSHGLATSDIPVIEPVLTPSPSTSSPGKQSKARYIVEIVQLESGGDGAAAEAVGFTERDELDRRLGRLKELRRIRHEAWRLDGSEELCRRLLGVEGSDGASSWNAEKRNRASEDQDEAPVSAKRAKLEGGKSTNKARKGPNVEVNILSRDCDCSGHPLVGSGDESSGREDWSSGIE